MSRKPINADVPAPEERSQGQPEAATEEVPAVTEQRAADGGVEEEERRRRTVPMTLKLLGALAVLAVLFIAIAILGGSGGAKTETAPAPAPTAKAPPGGGSAGQSAESLGYPDFATNNTTRVGGSDPASNAAAVALAVFPSATPSQRPAAVTLVGEEDWTGAIAASVLMSAPVRAPVLFSAPDRLPDSTAEALDALAPQGSSDSGAASLFAVGDVALPESAGKVARVDSGDPASTAAQIVTLRDRLFGSPPRAIVIASSSQPAFAMPAAAWAARSGDPVLFAGTGKLPQPTAAILEADPKARVYVLGPLAAVSAGVVAEIAKIDKRVKRVSGKDPAANAVAFARYRDGAFGWDVNDPGHGFVLARDDEPANAAAAAALSASGTWGPLLLSDDADTLPASVRGYFLDLKPGYTDDPTRAFYNHVWVIGNEEAIDLNEQAEVNELAELAKIGGEK